MNTPTISQLADIGAKAAQRIHSCRSYVSVDPELGSYVTDIEGREAFVQAVLDAVGYKLPVGPEREAYEKWAQQEGPTAGLFEAFKAGRAAILAEQVAHEVVLPHPDSAKPAPETFEAHGLTWFKHTPGDPMPCDGEAEVLSIARASISTHRPLAEYAYLDDAEEHEWGKQPGEEGSEIVGWRYADTP